MSSSEQEPQLADGESPNQRELQNLQRLAMVGTLASGLGHDLRNVVMPVLLRLDVLGASPAIPDSARGDLAAIRQSVLHLQRLAAGLRLLSSDPRQRSEVQFARLDQWWEDVCPLVVDALAPQTVLEHSVPGDLPTVAVPPSVLAQVVMNLAMNARRAMEGMDGPRMRVFASVQGDRVELEVSDNGAGMDAETRDRCFEPFFTTRPREVATGLGLSTGRALLQDFGADVRVVESKGEGSTFVMTLPLHREGAIASVSARRRTAHLVLPDPRQRAVVRLLLAQYGLVEWNAEDGEAATPPDVVIGDFLGVTEYRSSTTDTTDGSIAAGDATPRLIVVGPARGDTTRLEGAKWIDSRDLSSIGAYLR